MKENVFSKQLRDDIENHFDGKIDIILIQDSYKSGKKPYDFHILYKGQFIAFELKMENGVSFGLQKVSPHQPDSLIKKWENGGKGFFIICFIKQKIAFILTPYQWDNLTEVTIEIDRKSIKFETFTKNFPAILRTKIDRKTKWDIKELFSIMDISNES